MTLGDRNVRLCAVRLSVCLAAAAAISLAAILAPSARARAQAQPPSPAKSRTELQAQEQALQAAGSSQEAPEARSAGADGALPADYIRPSAVQPGLAPGMKVQERSGNQQIFEVRFSTGDELLSGLTDLALKNHITSAYITGIGGLSTGVLGWGDVSNGAFKKIPIDRKAELVSLVGDISMRDGQPYVHLHGVVAFSDGSTRGGHVIEAHVAPVAEIAVVALAMGGGAASAD
jgi:predicted DNA-binding protein with PD1-like motif